MCADTLKAAFLLGVNVNDTSVFPDGFIRMLSHCKKYSSEKYAHVPTESKSCNSKML